MIPGLGAMFGRPATAVRNALTAPPFTPPPAPPELGTVPTKPDWRDEIAEHLDVLTEFAEFRREDRFANAFHRDKDKVMDRTEIDPDRLYVAQVRTPALIRGLLTCIDVLTQTVDDLRRAPQPYRPGPTDPARKMVG